MGQLNGQILCEMEVPHSFFCSSQISRSLERTYIVKDTSIPDISVLLRKLSIIRALLTVQMDSDEEDVMISCLK
jgi:hypothetical protein